MIISKCKNIYDNISIYDYLCNDKDKEISITEWSNGEGWDITIGERSFSLTRGELDAINFLTKCLEYNYTGTKDENMCTK